MTQSNSANRRLANVHILLIESDERMIALLRSIFVTLGFPPANIHASQTPEHSWAMLNEVAIDLIVCDWRQSDMEGISLVKRIRASQLSFRNVPILMMTGHAEAYDVQVARDAGINEFLVKPFSVPGLCARLKEIIEKPRTFVIAPEFKGPDRRRRAAMPKDQERRHRRPKMEKPS